jgi:tyrocidine synthetase-3
MKRSIDPSLFERMLRLKNAAQVSLFSYMQASLSLLLCLTSGKKSIVTGSPFSSRMDKRLEDVVGNFVNLLPIHIHIEEGDTLRDHISKVQLSISKVMQHQSYPFNLMVQKSGFKRDPSRHPLFDILFVLQNHEEARFELNGMEIERKFIDPEHSKLDLFIELREVDGTLEFNFEYNDLIFTQDLIEDFFSNWKNLLEYMSGNPETSIAEVVSHYSLSNECN